MADPDEALIEAIARALCEIRCDSRWSEAPIIAHEREARAAYAAMVAHLGLVEETRTHCAISGPHPGACEEGTTGRRLVSRWTDAQP